MRFSRSKRATAALLGGSIAIALALSGCGGQAPAGDGGSATEGNINWWSWNPDNDVADRIIAAFNEEYPDIEVTFKKVPIEDYAAVLRPALTSNDGPDVFAVDTSGAFSGDVFAPYATDLTDAMKELLGDDWESKLDPAGQEVWTVDGRLIAASYAKNGSGNMWINQDMFDAYGLQPPTNLEEWKSVCETFRADGLGCYRQGMSGSSGFPLDMLHAISNSIEPGAFDAALAGERDWNDPVFVEALEIVQTMSTDGIIDEGAVGIQQYPDVNNAFLSGKVPMVLMGTWYQQYGTVAGIEGALEGAGVPADTAKITIMPIPFPDVAGNGNPSSVFADPDVGLSVNAKSEQRNAATTFALWLGASEGGAQIIANNLTSVPPLKGVNPQWDQLKLVNPELQQAPFQELTTELSNTTENRSAGLSAQVTQAIIDAVSGVTNGTTDPKSAADAIAATAASE